MILKGFKNRFCWPNRWNTHKISNRMSLEKWLMVIWLCLQGLRIPPWPGLISPNPLVACHSPLFHSTLLSYYVLKPKEWNIFYFFCNWWLKTIFNFVGHIYRHIMFCHPLQVWPATDTSSGSTQRDVTHVCSVASLEAAVKKWLSTSTVNTVVTEQLKTQGVGPQTYSVVEFFAQYFLYL